MGNKGSQIDYPESTVTFWPRQAANQFAIEHLQKMHLLS
jgi:hypothetical protein